MSSILYITLPTTWGASVQFSSVAQSCLTLCDPMDCSTPGFSVLHCIPELLKFMSIESLMLSNHLILCCPLLLLPSTFPSIRVFVSESALCIRWPKYWSFSFSISPSNEHSRLISFRVYWFDLLAVWENNRITASFKCQAVAETSTWETKHHTWRAGEVRFITPADPEELTL